MAKEKSRHEPPGSPTSVGWTEAQRITLFSEKKPFALEGGGSIGPVEIEYEAYGKLSPAKDNVVLIAHALSGDAHAAGWDRHAAQSGRAYRVDHPGWWDTMIGPGKPLDTNRFYILCSNYLGSCYGTTGPSSINPKTGKPFGLSFPEVSVNDWVRLQAHMLDEMGIQQVLCVVGGSLGGQQAIEWALAYPERIRKCIVLAASPRLSTQGLAFNAVGRYSILNDPHFKDGNYYGGPPPAAGLAAARMLAHITYLSDEGMHEKFGRRKQEDASTQPDERFGIQFQVESYLDYQGRAFVQRFDANSYLYISRAMDYYDSAEQWGDGDLVAACKRIQSRVMVVSFSSDWLYPPKQCYEFALALSRNRRPVTYVEVPSRYGHDAFLVETAPVGYLLTHFLKR